ncbi:methyltransferase-like protein 25B [Toxorhynchites rutilus septentrionalis]|uniref:methyltransferase-like protein 25B n=1 Tax=Toxorhynchites rutilus septentrionalis TaxID=329112 RepID=UPI00247A535C|nr:methyltransferase-like protein 25B [Toxorhynchites rutilus septentrionalis]
MFIYNHFFNTMHNASIVADLRYKIEKSFQLLTNYNWLINSYVLDFYVDNHWKRLPPCWQSFFDQLEIQNLKDLLTTDSQPSEANIWPLSILAIRAFLRSFCLPRQLSLNTRKSTSEPPTSLKQALQKLFDKSVKLKKRHEIEKFSEECWRTGRNTDVEYLVDIGSGQGNLARALAFQYGFKVCCIEQDEKLVETARSKDEVLSSQLKKQFKIEDVSRPIHLSKKVNLGEIDTVQFVDMIRDAFDVEKDAPFRFGLIGLHPCGDLATYLIKLFLSCPEAKFIKVVCCCYMKLTTKDKHCRDYGFPLSAFSNSIGLELSYEAREIACHAIEQYRLKLDTDYEALKVHAFRAALENIIVRTHPELKHSGLKSTKVHNMSFQQYCARAIMGLGIELPQGEMEAEETYRNLSLWERVVKFYTLRLMFAPLIESIILYDRRLFLLEQGVSSEIDVIFEATSSPRNHALTGCKSIN